MSNDVKLALALMKERDFEGAGHLLRGVLARNPKSIDALLAIGDLHLQTGQLAHAERDFTKVLRLDPKSAAGQFNLGKVAFARGNSSRAIACYRRAIAHDPNQASYHCELGRLLEQQGQIEEALATFRLARAIEPKDMSALRPLAKLLWSQGLLAEAEEVIRGMVALDPHQASLHNNLGTILSGRGLLYEAIECFQQAIRIAPRSASALSNFAVALRLSGRLHEAMEHHDRAIALAPTDPSHVHSRAYTLIEVGKIDDVISRYEAMVTVSPTDAESHFHLACHCQSIGRNEDAAALFRKTIALRPDHAVAMHHLAQTGRNAASTDERKQMQHLLNRRETSVSQRAYLAFALAKSFEDEGSYDKAFELYLRGNRCKRDTLAFNLEDAIRHFEGIEALHARSPAIQPAQTSGVDSNLPIFIVGMPRSGTTLVEQILAGHPDVYAAGELCDLAAIIHAQRDSNGNALFPEAWHRLDTESLSRAAQTYLQQLRQRPIGGAKRMTDKMPDNFEYVGVINQLFPSARIIHVRRDPMDTCLSIFLTLFATGHEYGYDMMELGTYYRLYDSMMEHYRSTAPANMIEVRYEALVEDLESEVRRMLAFCGLGFEPACLAFHERNRPVHTASVAQVREPMYRSSIGKWRRYERHLEPLRQALAQPMSQLRPAAKAITTDEGSVSVSPA